MVDQWTDEKKRQQKLEHAILSTIIKSRDACDRARTKVELGDMTKTEILLLLDTLETGMVNRLDELLRNVGKAYTGVR